MITTPINILIDALTTAAENGAVEISVLTIMDIKRLLSLSTDPRAEGLANELAILLNIELDRLEDRDDDDDWPLPY